MSITCNYCDAEIKQRNNLIRHYSSNRCRKRRVAKEREKLVRETEEKSEYITQIKVLQSRLQEKDARLLFLENLLHEKDQTEKQFVKTTKENIRKMVEEINNEFSYLRGKLDESKNNNLAILEMTKAQNRVKLLEKKYVKRQTRLEYPLNVVYLLTTDDLVKRRTYIVGKASNLTNRLSTYNKTAEHRVVKYFECKGKKNMGLFEGIVLSKMEECRESANRDRFILPDGKEEEHFVDMIESSGAAFMKMMGGEA